MWDIVLYTKTWRCVASTTRQCFYAVMRNLSFVSWNMCVHVSDSEFETSATQTPTQTQIQLIWIFNELMNSWWMEWNETRRETKSSATFGFTEMRTKAECNHLNALIVWLLPGKLWQRLLYSTGGTHSAEKRTKGKTKWIIINDLNNIIVHRVVEQPNGVSSRCAHTIQLHK